VAVNNFFLETFLFVRSTGGKMRRIERGDLCPVINRWPTAQHPLKGNAVKLSRSVIASVAKQSLFFQEIASSLTLLAMTAIL
jgi:hypothetical protein